MYVVAPQKIRNSQPLAISRKLLGYSFQLWLPLPWGEISGAIFLGASGSRQLQEQTKNGWL